MTDSPRLLLSSTALGWENLTAEQWQYPAMEPPERLIEAHEIVLPLAGPSTLEWHSGRRWQKAEILPGTFCFTPAGVCLQKRWAAPSEDLIVRLTPTWLTRAAEEMAGTRPVELLEQHGAEDPQIRFLGQALQAELSSGSPGGRLFADSLASAFAARLLASCSAFPLFPQATASGLSPSELRRALDFIQDNLALNLSLEGIAEAVGTSPTRLKTQFKQSTGWSPYQYVLQQRVEYAQRLLRRGDLTPGQVAIRVGFYDQSHLNRHFKRLVGVTPKEFQRSV